MRDGENPSESVTLTPKDDGTKIYLVIFGGIFAAILAGRFIFLAATNHWAELPKFFTAGVGLAALYGCLWLMRFVKNSFAITFAPSNIAWSNCLGRSFIEVKNIEKCTVQTRTYRGMTFDSLVFYLRDGTRKKTPYLHIALYPGLMSQFRKRYSFPIDRE